MNYRPPLDSRRLRWARRAQLAELHKQLAQRFEHLDRTHRQFARDLATTGFQLEEVEDALRRLEGQHGQS